MADQLGRRQADLERNQVFLEAELAGTKVEGSSDPEVPGRVLGFAR